MPIQRTRIWPKWAIGPDPTPRNFLNIQENFEQLADAISVGDPADTEPLFTPPTIEPYTLPSPNGFTTYWEMFGIGTGVQMQGNSPTAGGTTGGGVGFSRVNPPIASEGPYMQNGNAVLNATYFISAPTGGNQMQDLIWDFDTSFLIRTDSNAAPARRFLIGMAQGNPNADNPGEAGVYFRYSTAVPDGGWVGICHDGSSVGTRTATLALVQPSTRYLLRMRKVGGTAYFSINGGPETSTNSRVPTATRTGVGPKLRLTNLDGSAQLLIFSRAWGTYGA